MCLRCSATRLKCMRTARKLRVRKQPRLSLQMRKVQLCGRSFRINRQPFESSKLHMSSAISSILADWASMKHKKQKSKWRSQVFSGGLSCISAFVRTENKPPAHAGIQPAMNLKALSVLVHIHTLRQAQRKPAALVKVMIGASNSSRSVSL